MLEDFLISYLKLLKEEHLSQSTKRTYALHVRQFLAFIDNEGGLVNPSIEPEMFGVLAHRFLLKEQNASSANARASAIKHFFKLSGLPCQTIRRPQKILTTREPLTQAELNRFLEASRLFPLRDKTIALLLASTGMRLREFVHLNRNNIKFENGECVITITFGPTPRQVRLDAHTQEALMIYLDSTAPQGTHSDIENRPMFIDKKGCRLSMRAVTDSVKKIGWSARLSVNPALLRVTRLLLMAQSTRDVAALTTASGYQSRESTRRLLKAQRNDLSRLSIETRMSSATAANSGLFGS
ncbi:MAG: site-specific integrase [Cyanobacteria bacterium]|nr:site-specific integrase [Cyanobacteriota bacterium]